MKNARRLANQLKAAAAQAVTAGQASINREAKAALEDLKSSIESNVDDGVCDCTPYIEAARIKSEMLIQKQRADAEAARNRARQQRLHEAAKAAKLEAEAAKKAAEMVKAAREKAKADAEKMIQSLGSKVPASVAEKLRKQMEQKMVKQTEQTVMKALPQHSNGTAATHNNLNSAVEKIRLAHSTLTELKDRIKAMKAAMSSKKLHEIIKRETEDAMRKYVLATQQQRSVEQAQDQAPAGIQQWIPFDANPQTRKYKYVATDNKPSYLRHLKSAEQAAAEALENHSSTLTFLEDDQIAHQQAAALKEAELLRREQLSAARQQ